MLALFGMSLAIVGLVLIMRAGPLRARSNTPRLARPRWWDSAWAQRMLGVEFLLVGVLVAITSLHGA